MNGLYYERNEALALEEVIRKICEELKEKGITGVDTYLKDEIQRLENQRANSTPPDPSESPREKIFKKFV